MRSSHKFAQRNTVYVEIIYVKVDQRCIDHVALLLTGAVAQSVELASRSWPSTCPSSTAAEPAGRPSRGATRCRQTQEGLRLNDAPVAAAVWGSVVPDPETGPLMVLPERRGDKPITAHPEPVLSPDGIRLLLPYYLKRQMGRVL